MVKLCNYKSFLPGKVIAREGEMSEQVFFIIEGYVNCYKKACGADLIDTLTRGKAFGDEIRLSTTYIATTQLKCLCLALKDCDRILEKVNTIETNRYTHSMSNATIKDFKMIRVLGKGNFSTVSLAKFAPAGSNNVENKGLFALKCYSGNNSEKNNLKCLKEMIENEISLTSQLDSPFIVRSFGGFSNNDGTYFILEAMLGGDLYQLLQEKSKFSEGWHDSMLRQSSMPSPICTPKILFTVISSLKI